MATQGTAGTTITIPAPKWAVIVIALLVVVATVLAISVALTLLLNGGTTSPSAISETATAGSAGSQQGQAFDGRYAPAIPGMNFTFGRFDTPGRPGEVTDGGQVLASFLLLAGAGRTDEAMRLVDPNVPSETREYYEGVAREAASRQLSSVEINRGFISSLEYPGHEHVRPLRDMGALLLELAEYPGGPPPGIEGIGPNWPKEYGIVMMRRQPSDGPWIITQ